MAKPMKALSRPSPKTTERPIRLPVAAADGTAWRRSREQLRRQISKRSLEGISEEEIDAHFAGMPARYWEGLRLSELVWALRTVHCFLNDVVAADTAEPSVVTDWRQLPRRKFTQMLVCAWDGFGLLTKVAGYISAMRLNVARAQVYTRADNIVLDVFWLCDGKNRQIGDTDRLRQLAFLLKGGLSNPPRFASTWACDSHKYVPRTTRMTPVVTFNNTDSTSHTMVKVSASERMGLLHDMLQAMSENGLNIDEALINTIDEVAHDVFYVTDEHKNKLLDSARVKAVESAIVRALET